MKVWAYWAIVVALILFGGFAILSIGTPFLLLGIMLAVLFPWRTRRGALATGLAVILGLVVGYVLVAPLGCSTGTASTSVSIIGEVRSESITICNNILGITYEGSGNYNPGLLPALLAGIALATIAGVTTAWLYRRDRVHVPPDA
jgi:hypothetical protein